MRVFDFRNGAGSGSVRHHTSVFNIGDVLILNSFSNYLIVLHLNITLRMCDWFFCCHKLVCNPKLNHFCILVLTKYSSILVSNIMYKLLFNALRKVYHLDIIQVISRRFVQAIVFEMWCFLCTKFSKISVW